MKVCKLQDRDPKIITRSNLHTIFKKVIKRIDEMPEGHFKIKKMRGVCGVCEWGEGIKLDHRKPIIPTLIHEVLHDLYPDNTEEWVLRIESKMMQVISSKDIYKLMNLFLSKLEIT